MWIRRQDVYYTYGSDDDDDDNDDEADGDSVSNKASTQSVASQKLVKSGKIHGKCKCGSNKHKYTSYSSCPLNKRNKQTCARSDNIETCAGSDDTVSSCFDTDTEEEIGIMFCTCGSERGTHHRTCPLNP